MVNEVESLEESAGQLHQTNTMTLTALENPYFMSSKVDTCCPFSCCHANKLILLNLIAFNS